MPVVNWPPTAGTYPDWPPVEIPTTRLECATIQDLVNELQRWGFTRELPTAQERNTFFRNVQCDEGHSTNGVMAQSPQGRRYPFAYCVGATHKQLLVLWGPDYCMGGGSGE
jgi:hypothetical protein